MRVSDAACGAVGPAVLAMVLCMSVICAGVSHAQQPGTHLHHSPFWRPSIAQDPQHQLLHILQCDGLVRFDLDVRLSLQCQHTTLCQAAD